MPIYAYKCSSCGHEQDVLQKVSDARLTDCPSCQAETFAKQLTAAGFQLKGSGWYATDFKNGSGARKETAEDKGKEPKATDAKGTEPKGTEPKATDAKGTEPKATESPGAAKNSASAAPASGSCGHGGCSACS
jgi:putative FmdB family regulatory protein